MTNLLDTYAERLRAAGASHTTVGARIRVLRMIDRHLPHGLVNACAEELDSVLAACRANWTRTTYFSHLRGYYSTMVRAGKLTYDPTSALNRPKPGDATPNPVSDDQLAIALTSPDPWRTAVLLAAYEGLRCSEAADLERGDVTEDRVHVRHGKGGRARYVPTHPLVWEAVAGMTEGPVIRDIYGDGVTGTYLTRAQGRHWYRLGLRGVHLHRFRHWFGTTLVNQGIGIEVVCELMGHRSVATTQGYVRVAQSRREAAIRTLPKVAELASNKLGHVAA